MKSIWYKDDKNVAGETFFQAPQVTVVLPHEQRANDNTESLGWLASLAKLLLGVQLRNKYFLLLTLSHQGLYFLHTEKHEVNQ